MSFDVFYRDTFLPEHRHPANIVLHVAGTLASAGLVIWAFVAGQPLWALLYPLVHVGPGLIGHRLFERSAEAGDLRVTRRDAPLVWFIAGNHRMVWELATRSSYWR